MAIGFALRALARRRVRTIVAAVAGVLDFSSPPAGTLLALLTEDF